MEGRDGLTTATICAFNRQVLDGLPLKNGVVPGEIRMDSVVVGSVYRGAPGEDCRYLLDQMCAWLEGPAFRGPEEMGFAFAVFKAVLAHLYLAWIHPFDDGNGRTARPLEFEILLAAGVPTPAAHLLSNHYNQTRSEYYRQLDRASKTGGDILPFLEYAIQGLVDGLRGQIGTIREQQIDVTWRNYVYERFQEKKGAHEERQRRLVLALGQVSSFVPISKVKELTPRIATDYAAKSDKTLQRDLAEMESAELIERREVEVRARRELVLAFRPWRKEDKDMLPNGERSTPGTA